jgi:UDP-glucose 4-epimerase
MYTILLTGGLGYIGSHVAVELLNQNYNVIIVDDLSNSYPYVYNHIKKITLQQPIFYELKLNNLDIVFKNHIIDAVIHLAGSKSVEESVKDPLKYYDNNVCNLIHLLKLMVQYKIKNFIFSSSCTVYGQGQCPIDETSPIDILNPYGSTKLMCETILKDLANTNQLKSIILRYFNPAGSHESGLLGDDPKISFKNLFPIILNKHKNQHIFEIYGNDYNTYDGTAIRDYIHVVDLAKGHVQTLNYLLTNVITFDVFNLGTGCGYSVLDVIHGFNKQLEQPIKYIFKNRREGDAPMIYARCEKAKQILSWQPQYQLDDMIKHAILFYNYQFN